MKQIIRDGNLYKVLNDNSVIYQTTEGLLLLHWLERHHDNYETDCMISLGGPNMKEELKAIRAEHPRLMKMLDEAEESTS